MGVEFSHANQMMLFTQVLSLLDILRPFIFVKNQVSKSIIIFNVNNSMKVANR